MNNNNNGNASFEKFVQLMLSLIYNAFLFLQPLNKQQRSEIK